MAIADDFEIQSDKDIRYIGTTANYTVLAFHRWLQDLADDAAAAGDDLMDITKETPSDKSFDTIINLVNGFNIDDTAAQHLYGGSIIQSNGDVIYDGIQVLAPSGMRLEIIQNGALATNFWTTGLNADAPNGISHQFMIKVRTAAADIDGRRLVGITREWGKTFLEFKVNGTARGVNVMAFTGWADDLNNATSIGSLTGSPFTSVALATAGYVGLDVTNDGSSEFYYSEWDRGSASINQMYERLKYLTRRSETTTLYGLQGQLFRGITHEITVDGGTGTWSAFEAVSWSGGTGHAIEITGTAADFTLTGVTFTGYSGTSTNAAIYVNIASGSMTISISGGDTPSIRTAGATVTVVNAVTVKITVKDVNTGAAIENARVLIEADSGGDLPSGTDILTGLTNSSGILQTTSFAYTNNQPIVGKVRRATVANGTLYKTSPVTGTITSTGFDTTVLLIPD